MKQKLMLSLKTFDCWVNDSVSGNHEFESASNSIHGTSCAKCLLISILWHITLVVETNKRHVNTFM